MTPPARGTTGSSGCWLLPAQQVQPSAGEAVHVEEPAESNTPQPGENPSPLLVSLQCPLLANYSIMQVAKETHTWDTATHPLCT